MNNRKYMGKNKRKIYSVFSIEKTGEDSDQSKRKKKKKAFIKNVSTQNIQSGLFSMPFFMFMIH